MCVCALTFTVKIYSTASKIDQIKNPNKLQDNSKKNKLG